MHSPHQAAPKDEPTEPSQRGTPAPLGYLGPVTYQLTEEEAFKLIQRQSMDLRKSMREIAEAVLLAGELDQRAEKQRG